MPGSPIITLNNLTKNYSADIPSGVRDITFSIEPGKIISVVGESGSGKSTLLKLIYGLLSPDSGFVYFKDKLVRGPEEKLIPGHDKMKMVTQDFNLNVFAKVYENIASMLPNTDLKAKREETVEMMEFLRIDHLANKRVADLSGGEQQRVAIARAIITEPEVLLLDEPFSQVDALLKNELRADIDRLAKYLGITVILVSHDPVDGLSLADQLIILRRGRIIEIGNPQKLYDKPEHYYTAQLLANCNLISNEKARVVGIEAVKSSVVIYPNWIQITDSLNSINFKVMGTIYKGFYEEILLERQGVILRAFNLSIGKFSTGQEVHVNIFKYLEFNDEVF